MNLRFCCTLLLFVSASSFATPPYSGTVFVDSNILNAQDPSTFIQAIPNGTGSRQMFDRRVNAFIVLDALLFNAYYTDGSTIEIQVNPEFDASEATTRASFYGHAVGQLPGLLRVDVQTMWIHRGDQPFGGGNNNILIHTDSPGYHGEWLEETLFHEACHTSLDSILADTPAWVSAQSLDGEFISTYARDNPTREDVAESCLPYFAMKFRGDRISASTLSTFESAIPNRSAVLDTLNLTPIVAPDRHANFDELSQVLQLPGVRVGDVYYELALKLADLATLKFTVESAAATETPSYTLPTRYANGVLDVPLALVLGKRYSLGLNLTSSDPIEFQLSAAVELD